MTKKLLLPLGTLLIASPLALTISCSDNSEQNAIDYVIGHINPSESTLNSKTAADLSMILEEGIFNNDVITAMGVDIKLPSDLKGVTLKYEIDMPKYKLVKEKVSEESEETIDKLECQFVVKVHAIKKDHITKMRGFTLTSSDRVLVEDEIKFNNLVVDRIANHYQQTNNFGPNTGDITSSLATFALIKDVTFTDVIEPWPTTNVRLTMEVIDMLGLSNKWMPKKIESTSVWYSLKKSGESLVMGVNIVRPNADTVTLRYNIVKGE